MEDSGSKAPPPEQPILDRDAVSTHPPLCPFPPLWPVDAAHRGQSHNYAVQTSLIPGKKPKDFTAVCHLGILFAFFNLNFVAIDIGDMSPTHGG